MKSVKLFAPVAPPRPVKARVPMEMNSPQLIRELRDLIAALDRRVPQVQRAGEVAIARDAAALRSRALKRIEELEREPVRVDTTTDIR